jgi:hypothetical protein
MSDRATRVHSPSRSVQSTAPEPSCDRNFKPLVLGQNQSDADSAGLFYGQKVSQAHDITSRLANDDRDEDRGGPSGFEDKAARARLFAAEMGLQAFALLAAAEGAVSAYAHITGEDWKPYERDPEPATGAWFKDGSHA